MRTVAACIALLAAVSLPASAAHAAVVDYSFGASGSGLRTDRALRAFVRETLADPRGWSLAGRVEFRERRAGGRFAIGLAPPDTIGARAGCSAQLSCRSGSQVLLNTVRWARGTSTYPGARLRRAYRRMVVNHEVGHALGFSHSGCPRPSARARIMQQQSKALDGCRRSAWPSPAERAALAERLGVPAPSARDVRAARAREQRAARRARKRRAAGPARQVAPRSERPSPAVALPAGSPAPWTRLSPATGSAAWWLALGAARPGDPVPAG